MHGVPVAAWLESRKHTLPLPAVAQAAPEDLRFFVQCMELKKEGFQALDNRACRALNAPALARDPRQHEINNANY